MERGKAERFVCTCRSCRDEGRSGTALWHRALNEAIYHTQEKQKRLVAAVEAVRLGWGGITAISGITGLDRKTIARGIRELQAGGTPEGRVREVGGGRKKVEKKRRGDPPPAEGPDEA